jgi:hypothetical protein
VSSPPLSATETRREHLSFFRQSGWMLVANGIAGVCFTLANTPAGHIARAENVGKAEYATFGALLDSLILLGLPAGGLQAVFAQMASGAVDAPSQHRLRGTVRTVLTVVLAAWTLAALAIWFGRDSVLATLRIANPWALAATLGTALVGLLYPVFAGLLQGGQRFFWLGNTAITSGATRLLGVTIAVVALGHLAAGAMTGVLLGSVAALALAAWVSRDAWCGPSPQSRDWSWVQPWFALTIGMTAGTVMLGADSTFVQSTFSEEEKAFYVAAGKVGRALVYLTMPLALVLFPRIARSAATGQPTHTLKLALGATLGTGTAAALVCTAFPELPIRLLYFGNPVFLPAAELVPLFCWAMLPLTAAYTLVNSILARKRFAAVPWLILVAVGYALTLYTLRQDMTRRASPDFAASDLQPSWFHHLQNPDSPLDTHLRNALPDDLRQAIDTTHPHTPPSSNLAQRTAVALNRDLSRVPLHDPTRFAGIPLRHETASLLQRQPSGPDLARLNRLLLEDAYPADITRKPVRRLFDEFRTVIRTLGAFSLLLLAVAVLFSLPRRAATPAATPA